MSPVTYENFFSRGEEIKTELAAIREELSAGAIDVLQAELRHILCEAMVDDLETFVKEHDICE